MGNSRKKILIVDDSPVILAMLKDRFEQEGWEVILARNGIEGLKKAIEEQPDLIISDIIMPQMDGWEFCEHVRANPDTTSIPFIFLTQESEAPSRIKGFSIGADDYITKPFSREELVMRAKAILRKTEAIKESMSAKSELMGSVKALPLFDLLQVFAFSKKNCTIKVEGKGRNGEIYFRDGEIINAITGDKDGVDALYEILSWEDATFTLAPLKDDMMSAERRIRRSVDDLLLDFARMIDEKGKG